ncbi:MAG: SusC/RagA family TonB-linked outer membrane protein [Gilvibacter sp.]
MRLFLLPMFALLGSTVYAQISVSGNVSDATGPLPGVNVIVKGTSNGAQTDFDGNYTLNDVASDGTLVFSYVGYITSEVSVNGQTTINASLQEDTEALEEVVIIGYGSTTVKDATGAVTAVTSEDFNQGIIASPEQLIQGKTAGVQISQDSGEPGSGVAFRIRGTNSVRSNNNPLFVVDGVPLAGSGGGVEGANTGVGTAAARNPLNFLNPNDIEAISILKDASSTAIYGSRGANGVVIITTKSGRGARGGSWEVSSSVSSAKSANTYDLLNARDYLAASRANGFAVNERNFRNRTDWQDVVLRTSTSTSNNVSYSNNYGQGNVRATFGYGKQFGIVENSSLERITGRLNVQHRFLDDKLTVGLQTSYSRVNDEIAPLSGSAGFRGDLLGSAYSANPTWPNNPDFDGTGGLTSPAALLAYTENLNKTDRILVNFSTEYDFTNEFSAKVNLGYDYSDSFQSGASSSKARNIDQGAFGNGVAAINETENINSLLEFTVNYNKDFGNVKLDALAGYSYQEFDRSGRNISGWGFFTSALGEMIDDLENSANRVAGAINGSYQQFGYAPNIDGIFINRLFPDIIQDNIGTISGKKTRSLFVDSFDNADELQSFFGRVNVTIADKYLFTATMRADGSSTFGDNNKYGYFPSGAFAWKINEEDFVGDNVSTLKLRLNAGITGNQDGLGYANFVQRQRFGGGDVISDGGDINIPGTNTAAFANDDLKWEETLQYGAGLDIGFNNDRFTASVDFYRKQTTDLLFRVISAQPAAQPFVFLNLPDSEVVNQGVEFSMGYDLVDQEDFTWNASLNLTYNQNEITSLAAPFNAGTIRGQGLTGAFAQQFAEGQPLFSFFLREFEGFDATTGQPIQEDIQKFVDASALPDLNAGFSTSATYKDWTLSAYFNGQFGHYIYNNTQNAFFTAGAFRGGRNVTGDVLTTGESFDAAADVSTRFLEKGDFVRLQSASLSYNVPMEDDGLFKSMVLSLTGQNLFVITDYSGLDPEVSVAPAASVGNDLLNGLPVYGIDYTAFPRPRTITIGLNAKF